ncbi:MAG: ABC transporter permease [Deltaproteobacteria bacterium]|nr:ABC transporter permease [Deltaproteobacteria bacterium]MBW2361881.1 ABC transporter permease [Deltaproteobacteria bacterium]
MRAAGPASAGPWRQAWERLRHSNSAALGACLLAAIVAACALLPPALGLDPMITDPAARNLPPSVDYPFGRDALGRDVMARVLAGGRTSLLIGLAATASSVLIGVLVGALAGFYGGRVDEVLMRFVDFLYGVPYMFLVILVMLLFSDTARGDPLPVFLALGLVQWLTMARIVRGQVLALRGAEYVTAARALGASDSAILAHHVLPNTLGPIIVYATLTVPTVIILESFLSFLGLGVSLSWGELVAEGVAVINPLRSTWWLLFWPAGFLATTLLALNFLGDGLRDALDPRGPTPNGP